MKKKRLLSMAMALCLVLGSAAALPKNAFVDNTNITASAANTATSGKCGENVSWSLKDGVLTISGTGKMNDYVSKSSPFYDRNDIKSVEIKSGVTSIGNWAFTDCRGLTKITIPSSVTSIGNDAFGGCTILTSVKIPSSVTSIGAEAFVYCSSLKSITIPSSIKSIVDWTFEQCTSLTSVTIQKGVTSIGYEAFKNCTSLTSVTIPNSVTSIGDLAFGDCLMLSSVTIPKSVTSIGEYAIGFDSEGMQTGGGFTIYGVKGTAAEKYAKDYYLKFESIPKTTRLAGKGRFETAVEISKAGFPSGSKTVVLAYGLNYADALAGVSLAKAKNAPILLTAQSYLPSETLAEIKRLKATDVIILGGTGAVGTEVEKALTDNKLNIERIAGKSRFETATKIAQKMQTLGGNKAPEDVFFVYYNDFADALSVSTVAAIKDAPVIYLMTDGELDSATSAYLASVKGKVKNAYVIGGTGVISDAMMKKAGDALGVKPTRVFGKNRFETCVAVNNNFKSVLNGDTICIATGLDFPDALAGGVFAAKNKAPLLLINGKAATLSLSDKQQSYLTTKAPKKLYVFGGTGVVPDSHIQTVAAASV